MSPDQKKVPPMPRMLTETMAPYARVLKLKNMTKAAKRARETLTEFINLMGETTSMFCCDGELL